MRVIDEVRIARDKFLQDTGKDPQSVYLGRENCDGLTIFIVNADDHLAVS